MVKRWLCLSMWKFFYGFDHQLSSFFWAAWSLLAKSLSSIGNFKLLHFKPSWAWLILAGVIKAQQALAQVPRWGESLESHNLLGEAPLKKRCLGKLLSLGARKKRQKKALPLLVFSFLHFFKCFLLDYIIE